MWIPILEKEDDESFVCHCGRGLVDSRNGGRRGACWAKKGDWYLLCHIRGLFGNYGDDVEGLVDWPGDQDLNSTSCDAFVDRSGSNLFSM